MMICGWTTLMSQQRQPNCLIRHPICQIRARKKCCGPPGFSDLSTLFVPLMQTSILTSEIAFSSTMFANVWSTWFCQISEFAQIEQKMVSWAVSFLAYRNRADHNFFLCPYLAEGCLIRQFGWCCCDVRVSPPTYHYHVVCILDIIKNKSTFFFRLKKKIYFFPTQSKKNFSKKKKKLLFFYFLTQ